MVTFTQPITIYSQWKRGRESVWIRTNIPRASWYGHQGANIGESGLVTADQYVVRILAADMMGYILPDAWNALESQPTEFWTVQLGDAIVKGTVTDEVTTGITQLTSKYTECITVTATFDNRREVPFMQHLKIEGK